jgi:hypothetical protein
MPRWPGELETLVGSRFTRLRTAFEPRSFLRGRPGIFPAEIKPRRIWRIRATWTGSGTAIEFLERHDFRQVDGLADYFYVPQGWVTNGSDYFDPAGTLQFSVVQSKRFGLSILPRARKEIP